MSALTNVREWIEKLVAALGEGAEVDDGTVLRVSPGTTITLSRGDPDAVALVFEPPPELAVRRGVVHLRCTLRRIDVRPDEVRLAIDGWFDRRWPVTS